MIEAVEFIGYSVLVVSVGSAAIGFTVLVGAAILEHIDDRRRK